MVIKAVSKERIGNAMLEFDHKFRSRPEWQGWEKNQSHRYAIEAGGVLYPAKKIVSLATGVAVGDFSGGHPTNSYLKKRGFTIVELPREEGELLLQFTPGVVYDRKTEINGPFGGSRQSGIAASAIYPVIFLFTGDSGEQYGYADRWDDGAYLYTGEGQRGAMTLTRGNRAIAEHAVDGRALHLFKSLGKGKGCAYVGEFSCADMFTRIQPDVTGQDRAAIVFRLVPVGISGGTIEVGDEYEDKADLPESLAAARLVAVAACKLSSDGFGQSAPRKIYQRSRKVSFYVLMRAQGICESCEMPAPFLKKDGTPYLEPHHVNRLSDGGLDHPRYVAAVCPSCHREIHSGVHGALVNQRLKLRLEAIEG
ncbi:HNH endonuclease [Pseudomonas moraviensis]|uniref:HNH endonuclease n=1 Tax=Pseudomonas TaxID=286 RepID=UPI000F01D9DD|nr:MULTISPECIES: HNH endonuclease signature motif containing protein [Pseudomonas]MBJ7370610.1 HNH endonuclease [Pseudomonas sp.]MBR7198970.1 HNH endonuclease [Pseudomonas sp. 14A]MXI45025.1 HNH endonuclease [Pseudomonas moraviensis]UVL12942.1 HNH endonuclease [Pseudomonas atacamensis]